MESPGPAGGEPLDNRPGAERTTKALGPLRVGVLLAVGAAAVLGFIGLIDLVRVYDARADHYSSLSYLDLVYGVQRSPDLWPPRPVIEDALATMPEDARYSVTFGPGWRSSVQKRWTNELTAGFLNYFLLPRRQAGSGSAPWVFCFACDAADLGGRFRVLSESADGLRFGRIEN